MKNRFFALVGISFLGLFGGCGGPDFLYYQKAKELPTYGFTQKIKDIAGITTADILFQVGGMTELETTLVKGADTFITLLSNQHTFNWKVGVVSNDSSPMPLLGFATPFDSTTANPIPTFVQAVTTSVENYDGETEMDPIYKALTFNPSFLRSNALLIVIMSNDAHDYSTMKAQQFLTELTKLKGGYLDRVLIYGVMGSTDLGCNPNTIDEDWNYKGSSFETLINSTHGKIYSLCTEDFGTSLGKIGDDFIKRLAYPHIYLSKRPVPTSIVVNFHGVPLKPGRKEDGGLWTYDFELNAVTFYDLGFAPGDDEQVDINYQEDQGL